MASNDANEYGGQTSKRMSNRPLQKQSTAAAAGAKGATPRMATANASEENVAGTRKGGPASVRGGNAKHGPTTPRRFKVKRFRRGQLPEADEQIGMQDRSHKGPK